MVSGDLSTFQRNSTTVALRQVRHVERIVIHPEYNEAAFKNDVAILLVSFERFPPIHCPMNTNLSHFHGYESLSFP